MEQIIIHQVSGGELRLFSNNAVSGVTRAEQVCELMGQDVVNVSVSSATSIIFQIGDYIEVFGTRYTLNAIPDAVKEHDRLFHYELRFEGPQYDLIKVQYIDVDSTGFSTGTSFSLMGNLSIFLQMLIRNLERVYGAGSWSLGTYPATSDTYNLTFTSVTCLEALQLICEAYDQHFDIEKAMVFGSGPGVNITGYTYKINIRKVDTVMPDIFRYGRAKGLYRLERQKSSSKNILTRLFAFGSDRNLAPGYRNGSPRLKLPAVEYIQDAAGISAYGVIEGSVIFDDIYPHRVGTVTAIETGGATGSELVFYDASMPFNLTEVQNGSTVFMLNGIQPKIKFNTGNLAGYEFTLPEIGGYSHTNKKFTLQRYIDSRGQDFPSANTSAFRIQVGDEYVITDITLPQAYIDAAEAELLSRATEYLAENSKPWVRYGLTVDQNYILKKAETYTIPVVLAGVTVPVPVAPGTIINYFTLGHYMKVLDNDFGLNGNVQIIGFTRDVLNHYSYNLTLADTIAQRQRVRGIRVATSNYPRDISDRPKNDASVSPNVVQVLAKTTGGTSVTIEQLLEALPKKESYTVTENSEYFYHDDLFNTTILSIVRNGLPDTTYTQQEDWSLYFPGGLQQLEVLHVLFRKNIS